VHYTRLFTGTDGESHFEEVEVELLPTVSSILRAEVVAARSAQFLSVPRSIEVGWHHAPQRQFVIVLQGE
jgi:hypothetical protein